MGSIQKFSGGFFSASGREGWVGGYVGGSVHEGSFQGGREIAMKGAPDLPALFIGYWEIYRHFQEGFFSEGWGWRRGLLGRIFPWRMFFWGKGHFYEGGAGFPSII